VNVQVGSFGEIGQEGMHGQRTVVNYSLIGASGSGFRIGCPRSLRLGVGEVSSGGEG
jgi:hypothetical protein